MGGLGVAALIVIFLLVIMVAVVIVVLGTLPGKIARKRGHPHPQAVDAASWIGLATGIFWPLAFIWAFLPIPAGAGQRPATAEPAASELADLRQRLDALESAFTKAGDAS